MTAHAWSGTGRELEVLGGRPRPMYSCPRCGTVCVVGYAGELEPGWAARGGRERADPAARTRVRVVGHERVRDPIPEDCDEELARQVLSS